MVDPGPYYTCLVDMRQVRAFPYEYALYFSTDHDGGVGGICLYVCNGSPTDAAGWRSYDAAVAAGDFDHVDRRPAANPIFVDSVQGRGHTKTPHVNVIYGTVYMTYHKNGIEDTQRTLLGPPPPAFVFRGSADKKTPSFFGTRPASALVTATRAISVGGATRFPASNRSSWAIRSMAAVITTIRRSGRRRMRWTGRRWMFSPPSRATPCLIRT